jgi:hypothetical protein
MLVKSDLDEAIEIPERHRVDRAGKIAQPDAAHRHRLHRALVILAEIDDVADPIWPRAG